MSSYEIVNMQLIHIDQVLEIENKSFKTPWSRESFISELERNKCANYRVLIIDDSDNMQNSCNCDNISGHCGINYNGSKSGSRVGRDNCNNNSCRSISSNSNSNSSTVNKNNKKRVAAYGGLWHVVDEGHITNIAVHPDFRGQGLGAAIVEDMIVYAKQMHISALTLEVRTGNITAINLYKKYGFKEIAIRKNYYADTGEDAIIMWKNDIQA